MMAGSFSTSYKAEVKIKCPQLKVNTHIFVPFHITSQKCNYNVIFGHKLLQELGKI